MNLDQFCQVALLPQGHFQAFLRADSDQRHRLLRGCSAPAGSSDVEALAPRPPARPAP